MNVNRKQNIIKFIVIAWTFLLLSGLRAQSSQLTTIDSLKQLYEQSNKEEDRIIYLSKIAFYNISTNPDSALLMVEKSLESAKRIDYQDGIASCYNTMGWAFFQKGQNEKAVNYIQSAIEIYQKNKNNENLFSSYFNLSSIFIRQENYAEALKYLLRTLSLLEIYPNHTQSVGVYRNLGIVYREMKDYDKAIEYFNKAIDVNLKNNNKHLAADIKISLGILYNQINKNKLAIKEYEECYELYQQEKSLYGMSIVRENEGELYLKLKKYPKALICFEEAKSGYEQLGNKADLAYISMSIARLYTAMRDFPQAIKSLERGLVFSQEVSAKNYEMDIYGQFSETFEEEGNYASALKYNKIYQALKDSLQSEAEVNQLNRVRVEFETQQKDKEITLLNTEKALQNEKSNRRLGIMIATLLGAISLAVALYIRSKLLENENLLALKENELTQQKQQQTEQKLLRSQMNPHFIFNCLNTIDSFVLQNRKQDASRLIQRFSKLSRQILEFTSQSEILVEEAMGMIKVYLQIEQTRYSGNFDFSITINEQVEKCLIAPMIIQPFIENAIIHGIKNLEDGRGFISVQVEPDGDFIRFTVCDNGVGRLQSQLIKKEQTKSHNSKAMEITTARLAAIHKSANVDDYIKYTDFEGEISGTKVEIWLPKILPILN